MHLRTIIHDNDGVDFYWHIFRCDRCGIEVPDNWPHYSNREQNTDYCWECTYINGLVTEERYIRHTGCAYMKDAHASIIDGKVFLWVGKTPPWEIKPSAHRRTKQYREWRLKVFNRDGHKCKHCGGTENLEAHHIKPFAKYEKYRFKVSNGLTLCTKCHKDEHKRLRAGVNRYGSSSKRKHGLLPTRYGRIKR